MTSPVLIEKFTVRFRPIRKDIASSMLLATDFCRPQNDSITKYGNSPVQINLATTRSGKQSQQNVSEAWFVGYISLKHYRDRMQDAIQDGGLNT